MSDSKRPLGYLGGDIMSFGSNLARQYEYDKFKELNLPVDVYSPVQNKSINDKANMTEEQNNHLAEKITEADIERLWNSDFVVMEPAQNAIGSMCEIGCLYGWKYLTDKLLKIAADIGTPEEVFSNPDKQQELLVKLIGELNRINKKDVYCHYFDIRTNHLNEKDWRRSFSINQLLLGMIIYVSSCDTPEGIDTFDNIMKILKEKYGEDHSNEQ